MAIGVTVNYTIEDIDFHDSKVQIKYLLENDEAPLTKRYLEVYGLDTLYSGLGETTLTADREDLIQTNFLSLTSSCIIDMGLFSNALTIQLLSVFISSTIMSRLYTHIIICF